MHPLAVLLLLLAAVTSALAQPSAAAPTRVFLSGHSLTDLPMPAYFARVAASLAAPVEWQRQYMVGSAIKYRARGRGNETGWAGYRMGYNREGEGMDVVAELRRNPYDVLVITEQHGLLDSLLGHDAVRYLRHYHDRFIDGNPDGRTFFYEPWLGLSGQRDELRRWIDYEREASPLWQCMATRVNHSLQAEGRRDRILSLPAGWALAELVERATLGARLPGVSGASDAETIDRIFHDSAHLRPLGHYYIALVVFATLFERAPLGAWAPPDVSAEQAASLQRVAGEAIARYRARQRPLDARACSERLRGAFVGRYIAHMRDYYWVQQEGNALRKEWRRQKQAWRTRWTLWREDPLRWDAPDAGYWFAAP